MKKLRFGLLLALLAASIFLFAIHYGQRYEIPSWQKKDLQTSAERILILAPHPDDEVLGCAGIIQRAKKLKIPVKIVFLTYGDNNQWSFLVYRKHPVLMPKAVQLMGEIRRSEAIDAGKILGVKESDLIFLGYPDFKTLNIWYSHWNTNPPIKSMFTDTRKVPYANAFHPGAPYKGESILEDLKTIIRDFKPTKIFVSHPADHNADHRSLYLFARVALWDLQSIVHASIHPYLIHYKNWPLPRGFHPMAQLSPPKSLKDQLAWTAHILTPEEIGIKNIAIQQHRSQYRSTPGYLRTFIRSPELFGDFKDIPVAPNAPDSSLVSGRDTALAEPKEELLSSETSSFVGIEENTVHIDNNSLVLSIKLSNLLGKTAGLSLYAFGYRADAAFKDMPKIRLRFANIGHKILDQTHQIKHQGVIIERKAKELRVRIPLDLLGNPQKILTSASTYLGAIPLDWVAWRILDLQNYPKTLSTKE